MLNEYEQRREARIARNREILMRLVGDLPAHKSLMEADQPSSPKPKSAKRKAASIPEGEQRRSGRIRNMPAPIYTSFEADEDLGDAMIVEDPGVGVEVAEGGARTLQPTLTRSAQDAKKIRTRTHAIHTSSAFSVTLA